MSDDSLTTIETDKCRYEVRRTSREATLLGPIGLTVRTGAVDMRDWLEGGEARALIAALQLVVDDVEREGQEKFDQHVERQHAETKFLEMPASAGVGNAR